MRSVKKAVSWMALVSVLGYGAVGYAQPSIPQDRIPPDVPAELREGIERLYSSDAKERVDAVGHLIDSALSIGKAEWATPAIPFLIAMFHDDTALYDDAALKVRVLMSSGPSPNSPGEVAAVALGRLASKTVPPIDALLVAFEDKDWHVRANAIRALAEIRAHKERRARQLGEIETRPLKNLRVLEPLVVGLKDKNPKVRVCAARSLRIMELEKLGTKDSLIEGLVARLDDEDRTVRAEVARTLGSTKDSRAVGPLIVVLQDLHEDLEVRQNATEALGQIGDLRAVQPLVVALKDRDWSIRSAALTVTGLIKDFRVLRPIVIDALQDKEWRVRARAASAALVLGKLKDPGVFDVMIVALNDNHPNVRARATRSLAELNDVRAVTPLITTLLHDGNSYVRWHAARALGKLGDHRAMDPLTAALKDGNALVRLRAQEALKELRKALL